MAKAVRYNDDGRLGVSIYLRTERWTDAEQIFADKEPVATILNHQV